MKTDVPSEASCKRATTVFDDVNGPGYRYAMRKKIGVRAVKEFVSAENLWKGFPDDWDEYVVGMLAVGTVFGRSDRVAAFLRGTKEEVSGDLLSIIRLWRDRPWVWAFVHVVEDLGDRRLRVKPVGAPPSTWRNTDDWPEMIVYSRSMAQNYDNGIDLFFIQLVDVGPAFVTNGVVVPLRSFERSDALFYADIVANTGRRYEMIPLLGVADESTPVSDIAAKETVPFLALFRYSEMPAVRTPHGMPGRFLSATALPADADPWSEQRWRDAVGAAGERLSAAVIEADAAAIVFGDGSPMYDPTIYLSRGTGRAFLDARTREAYDRGRSAAGPLLAFPEKPDVVATLAVLGAATTICGLDETLQDECGVLRNRFERQLEFTGPPDGVIEAGDGPHPSSIEQAQKIADRLIRNHNDGVREQTAAIAADLGVEPAVVETVRRQIEARFSRMGSRMSAGDPADRFGLSPRAFAMLSRGGVPTVEAVLRLRETDELRPELDRIGQTYYVNAVRWLLARAIDDRLPATKAGYISPPVVSEAYDLEIFRRMWDDYSDPMIDAEARERLHEKYRPRKEADLPVFRRVRALAEDADLLRLSGTRFIPTDTAHDLLDDDVALYHHLITVAFRGFDWAQNDRFEFSPALHKMSGFLFYAAGELCDARRPVPRDEPDADWVPVQMLVDRYIGAVPTLAEAVRAEAEAYIDAKTAGLAMWTRIELHVYFVDLFAAAFGLFETKDTDGENPLFRTTPLFDTVFDRG
ncbi:MAG: hypothetical protein EA426_11425 [Spirochaetaceae bacterium]|nr:MAG: hypothetical protein EA426_11425 [Spirochaetaceae bacterium]